MDINLIKEKINRCKSKIYERKGAYDTLLNAKELYELNISNLQEKHVLYHKALLFIKNEMIEKRNSSCKIIEELGTNALQAIYDKSYKLILKSQESSAKKDDISPNLKMEFLIENEIKDTMLTTDLVGARGGGVAEIVSFSLRIAVLSLLHYDGALLLDESYKSMSIDSKIDNVANFLRFVSETLNRQIIFTTHQPNIFEDIADAVIIVEKDEDMVAKVSRK